MRRFLSAALPSSGQTVLLDKEVSHHLLRVVGIAPLEQVELFDGQGSGLRCMFTVCTERSSRNGLGIHFDGSSTAAYIDPCVSVDQRRCFWHRTSDVYRIGCRYIYTLAGTSVDSERGQTVSLV